MRLINTNTRAFEEFNGRSIPQYAILSHTWEEDEITFKDMECGSARYLEKKGYRKIEMTCRLAAAEGLRYAWIDTCCIDKSSSAELTESINSMFRWYKRSAKCYVYLSDLEVGSDQPWQPRLEHCRWWTRGWTLQELIAPSQVDFFDQEWSFCSAKKDCLDILSAISGVSVDILRHARPLSSVSVAQRMSWTAKRQTTRIEDTAYCLLGIFGINMPLLYGEEEKAFLRLQEEILKTQMDLSILAWTMPGPEYDRKDEVHYAGALAQSPSWFHQSAHLTHLADQIVLEFSISNKGIQLNARVMFEQTMREKRGLTCFLPLCSTAGTDIVGIYLKKCGSNLLVRKNPHTFAAINKSSWTETWDQQPRLLLAQLPETEMGLPPPALSGREFILRGRRHTLQLVLPPEMTIEETLCWPVSMWDSEDQLFFMPGEADSAHGAAAVFMLSVDLTLPAPTDMGSSRRRLHCVVYALGWGRSMCSLRDSEPGPIQHELQLCLLDPSPKEVAIVLQRIHSRFGRLDFRRCAPLKAELEACGIPKPSDAVYLFGELGVSIVVSCTTTLVQECAGICDNPFWRLQFSWKALPRNETPLRCQVLFGPSWS